MKILWTLFVLAILSSCVTQKRCAQKFPPSVRDSISYVEHLRDVPVYIKGDSIKVESKVPCDNFDILTENTNLKIQISVRDGKIRALMSRKPDTVKVAVKDTESHRDREATPPPVVIKETPLFWKITGWIGICSVIMIATFVYIKFR